MASHNSPARGKYSSPYYAEQSGRSPSNYSPQFLSELESQHEKAISSAHEKLRMEQVNHDKIVEALRNQVASLRQQLDLSEKVSQAELSKVRESTEDRLARSIREKEERLTFVAAKASDLQRQLDGEIEKNSLLRQEILSMKLKHSEETGRMEAQTRALKQEVDLLRNSSLPKAENELQRVRGESSRREEEIQMNIAHLRTEHEAAKEQMLAQLRGKDSIIQGLEAELNEVKSFGQSRKQAQERDMDMLQGTVNSSKKVISLYEQEIERLKQSRDEAKKEATRAIKEAAVSELETARLKAKNEQLESQIEKMQRLLTKP